MKRQKICKYCPYSAVCLVNNEIGMRNIILLQHSAAPTVRCFLLAPHELSPTGTAHNFEVPVKVYKEIKVVLRRNKERYVL